MPNLWWTFSAFSFSLSFLLATLFFYHLIYFGKFPFFAKKKIFNHKENRFSINVAILRMKLVAQFLSQKIHVFSRFFFLNYEFILSRSTRNRVFFFCIKIESNVLFQLQQTERCWWITCKSNVATLLFTCVSLRRHFPTEDISSGWTLKSSCLFCCRAAYYLCHMDHTWFW